MEQYYLISTGNFCVLPLVELINEVRGPDVDGFILYNFPRVITDEEMKRTGLALAFVSLSIFNPLITI